MDSKVPGHSGTNMQRIDWPEPWTRSWKRTELIDNFVSGHLSLVDCVGCGLVCGVVSVQDLG